MGTAISIIAAFIFVVGFTVLWVYPFKLKHITKPIEPVTEDEEIPEPSFEERVVKTIVSKGSKSKKSRLSLGYLQVVTYFLDHMSVEVEYNYIRSEFVGCTVRVADKDNIIKSDIWREFAGSTSILPWIFTADPELEEEFAANQRKYDIKQKQESLRVQAEAVALLNRNEQIGIAILKTHEGDEDGEETDVC